jgi:hypothetical protein
VVEIYWPVIAKSMVRHQSEVPAVIGLVAQETFSEINVFGRAARLLFLFALVLLRDWAQCRVLFW